MIELWDEAPVNNWRAIRKARDSSKRQTWTNKLVELAGCLAIGLILGWMFGKAW